MKARKFTQDQHLETDIIDEKINRSDAELFRTFIKRYATLKKLSQRSIDKTYYCNRAFLKKIKSMHRSVPKLTEQDALALIDWLQTHQKWGEATKEDYWDRFTRFYKWTQKRNGPYDPEVKTLFCGDLDGEDKYVQKIDKNKIIKKGILAPEEVLKIVTIEPTIEYKALLSVIFASGMRAGEAFTLQYRDVESVEGGYLLQIRKSKTERRPVPISDTHFASSYLRKWLRVHPHKKDVRSLLFLNTLGEEFTYAAVNKRIRSLLDQAGIEREKISMHSLRHSRATEMANKGMSEARMCKFFGWKIGSRQPATYIRASSIDVSAAVYELDGQKVPPKKKELECRKCLHCTHSNDLETEYCDNCSLPLDAKRLERLQTRVDMVKSEEYLEKLMEEKFEKKIQRILEEVRNI